MFTRTGAVSELRSRLPSETVRRLQVPATRWRSWCATSGASPNREAALQTVKKSRTSDK
jgi:hypothetical protein